MKDPFLVVPTLGNRPSLWSLLRDADMPCMVVWTGPVPEAVAASTRPDIEMHYWVGAQAGAADVTVRIDHDPIDIHRWWRKGFELASSRNLGAGVVVNDDVRAAPGALRRLAEAVTPGTPLAYLDRPEHAAPRCTAITGWCFATAGPPDWWPARWEAPCDRCRPRTLRWWYGDHDLELRALGATQSEPKGESGRVARVADLDIEHLRTDWRYDRPSEVLPLIERDRELFNARWGWKVGMQ